MAPPGPREGSPTFFTTFTGYTFDASLTVLQNFQRLAIKRGWAVTSPTWRRNWSACFSRPFTADQNPFLYAAREFELFASFPDYHVDRSASLIENFKRLSRHRGWEVGSKRWRRNWKDCFGHPYTNDQNPFDSDSDSDSDSGSDDEEDNYVISDTASLTTDSGSSDSVPNVGRYMFENKRAERLHDQFTFFFGDSAEHLDSWQKLCRVVGVEVGKSITQCKKALKDCSVMINLVNLLHHMRSLPPQVVANPDALPYPHAGVQLLKFKSWEAFRSYTRKHCFPKEVAKANRFVSALLRQFS